MDDEERHSVRLANCRRFAEVREMSGRREADLLILDGILGAISAGMVDEGIVVDFLKTKPPRLELVLTGRNLSPALLELSDYVSEFVTRKHSFETSRIMPRQASNIKKVVDDPAGKKKPELPQDGSSPVHKLPWKSEASKAWMRSM